MEGSDGKGSDNGDDREADRGVEGNKVLFTSS